MFLKKFNAQALVHMYEYPMFCDDHIMPKDIMGMYHRKLNESRRKRVETLHQGDDFQIEKFLLENVPCKGPSSSPTCLYDFTNSIRLVD